MEVNGRTLISSLSANGVEGFETTVLARWIETTNTDGKIIEVPREIIGGTFLSIKDAVKYAMAWSDPKNPPAVHQTSDEQPPEVHVVATEEAHS